MLLPVWYAGVVVKMEERAKPEASFYYFKPEDHVPDDRLPRLIDRYVDFDLARAQPLQTCAPSNSRTPLAPTVAAQG